MNLKYRSSSTLYQIKHVPCAIILQADFLRKPHVMVTLMYQLDQLVLGCSDVWSNIILGASSRVFLEESSIQIGRLSKADFPSESGWVSSNQLKAVSGKLSFPEEKGIVPPDGLMSQDCSFNSLDFLACWSALQISDLPAPRIALANLKSMYISH